MLERTRGPRHDVRLASDRGAGPDEFITYADIARFFSRYWLTIAISVFLSLAAAGYYVISARPMFTARAQILIDPRLSSVLREQLGETTLSLDSPQVESQIAVLTSEELAGRVVKSLNLVDDPEFQSNEPTGLNKSLKSLLTQFKSVLVASGLINQHSPPSESAGPTKADADIPLEIAISIFLSRLDVRRVGMSYAIDISFRSFDPKKSARIANALAEAFVADQLETQSRAVRLGSSWLEERIEQIRLQMNEANLRVQEFKAKRDYRIIGRNGGADQSSAQSAKGDTGLANRELNTLEALESTAQTYRKIYETFLQAFAEAVQRQSFPVSSARIISRATAPLSQSHPKTKLVLAFGALLGCMIGFGISLIHSSLDRSVRSPRQIRDELGLECLGQVPRLSERLARRGFAVLTEMPFSRFSDEMKKAKTAIDHARKAQRIRSLGITSTMPGEGKSTFTSNLAQLFSTSGTRTLIIDGDFRNSTITHSLAKGAKLGLVELLQDGATAEQCIVQISRTLGVLPIVGKRRVLNSSDLLGSDQMRLLLNNLTQTYDLVILDSPPLNVMADGLAVSPLLDAVVLVAEWGETPLQLLGETAYVLSSTQAMLLGVVITKVSPKSISQQYRTSFSYYY